MYLVCLSPYMDMRSLALAYNILSYVANLFKKLAIVTAVSLQCLHAKKLSKQSPPLCEAVTNFLCLYIDYRNGIGNRLKLTIHKGVSSRRRRREGMQRT